MGHVSECESGECLGVHVLCLGVCVGGCEGQCVMHQGVKVGWSSGAQGRGGEQGMVQTLLGSNFQADS